MSNTHQPNQTTPRRQPAGAEFQIPRMPLADIQRLAKAMISNEVFSTWNMHLDYSNPEQAANEISAVFMVLMFGAFEQVPKDRLSDIGLIYEYINQAHPISVNGYPSFFSCRLLHSDDLPYLKEAIKHYNELNRGLDQLVNLNLTQMSESAHLHEEQARTFTLFGADAT